MEEAATHAAETGGWHESQGAGAPHGHAGVSKGKGVTPSGWAPCPVCRLPFPAAVLPSDLGDSEGLTAVRRVHPLDGLRHGTPTKLFHKHSLTPFQWWRN